MRTCAAKVQLPSECRISHSSQSTYFDAVALGTKISPMPPPADAHRLQALALAIDARTETGNPVSGNGKSGVRPFLPEKMHRHRITPTVRRSVRDRLPQLSRVSVPATFFLT